MISSVDILLVRCINEINILIKEAAERAETIIKDKKDKIEELVKVLLEKEIVEKEDFIALMGPGACRPEPPSRGCGGRQC